MSLVAAVKYHHVCHHSVDYILSGTLETRSSFSHFELKVLSKPVLGGITSVEHSITS